jgi:hypothetical protein
MSLAATMNTIVKKIAAPLLRRPDGVLVERLHPYRRMLAFMMPGRNESVCYYDDCARADKLEAYIERARERFDCDITHCLVAAAVRGLHRNPTMNRFVAGRRLYQRNHVAVTFTMKRKKLDKEAQLAAVKLRFDDPDEPFASLCARINDRIGHERAGSETYTDKELDILTALPRPLLDGAMSLVRWADFNNLLPASFIENDGFFTSMVIANLGSLGMAPAFHHLYEYGTSPLFMMVGKIEERALVVDGKVVAQRVLPIRWSYDERIDDGLTSKYGMASVREALEDPEAAFGALPSAEGARPAFSVA